MEKKTGGGEAQAMRLEEQSGRRFLHFGASGETTREVNSHCPDPLSASTHSWRDNERNSLPVDSEQNLTRFLFSPKMDPDFAISTKKEDLIATALSQAPDQAITSGAHSVFALSAAALYVFPFNSSILPAHCADEPLQTVRTVDPAPVDAYPRFQRSILFIRREIEWFTTRREFHD